MVSSDMEKNAEEVSAAVVKGIGVADVLPNFQYAFVGFGPSVLERDPDIGVRFLIAYLQGAKDFIAGKTPKFLDDLARVTRMNPDLVKGACREMFVPDGNIDPRSLEIYRDWAVSKGYSREDTPIADLVDTSYLDEARKRLEGKTGGERTG